jgi:hypothetical protein
VQSAHDVASLSHESLDFGFVPQFAAVSRIVFIKNKSQHTLSYVWEEDLKQVKYAQQVPLLLLPLS